MTSEQRELIVRNLRALDCGHHYCRYCEAGTSNNWVHSPFCPYPISVREVEEAKQIIAAFLPAVSATSDSVVK